MVLCSHGHHPCAAILQIVRVKGIKKSCTPNSIFVFGRIVLLLGIIPWIPWILKWLHLSAVRMYSSHSWQEPSVILCCQMPYGWRRLLASRDDGSPMSSTSVIVSHVVAEQCCREVEIVCLVSACFSCRQEGRDETVKMEPRLTGHYNSVVRAHGDMVLPLLCSAFSGVFCFRQRTV